jgi:hypothetical protein
MHRSGRYLLRLFTLTFAVAWLAVAAAWLRSHWRGDSIAWETRLAKPTSPIFAPREDLHRYLLISGDGGIGLVTQTEDRVISPAPTTQRWDVSATPLYPQPWVAAAIGRAPARATATTRLNLPLPSVPAEKLVSPSPPPRVGTLSLAPAPTNPPRLTDAVDMYRLKTPAGAAPAELPSGSGLSLATPGANMSATGPRPVATELGSPLAVGGGIAYSDSALPQRNVTINGGAVIRPGVGTIVFNPFTQFLVPPPNPVPTGSYRFISYSGNSTPLRRYRVLIAPYWSILVLTAPLLWIVAMWDARLRRRARRAARGECLGCGYDLRATADRCPECGLNVPEGHVPLHVSQMQSGEESPPSG